MNRNRHIHKEPLPSGDYLDTDGDIRHPDDNPEGFAAEGPTYFVQEDTTPYNDDYYEELISGPEYQGVAVELGFRASNLLLATDALAHASMLKGLLKSGNRKKIAEFGGEATIGAKIKRYTMRGRQALSAASGIDAMLERPDMVPGEHGAPYSQEDAQDDIVQIMRQFRNAYTTDAMIHMPSETPIIDKIHKKREVDSARFAFRQQLGRQVLNNKIQS